jgi:exopolysaccharide production protein ExoZ
MYRSIQGCRALAAVLVVLHHLGGAIASGKYFGVGLFAVPFVFGDSGVEFFFVLSGFIIVWAHFHEFGRPASLSRYLRKRVVRIYPTYWLIFVIVYLLAQASPPLRSTVPHDFVTLLKSLALVPQDPYVVGVNGAPVLIVAWSLQYEICFYVLIAIFIASRPLGILICVPLLINLGSCQLGGCSFPRSFFSNNLILLFGLGALIAYCNKRCVRIRRPTVVAAVAATAFLAFGVFEAIVGTETLPVDRRLIYGLLAGVVIFALAQAEDSGELRIRGRWVVLLGDSSYSLYLIHYPLISALCKLMLFLGLVGNAGALIAYSVILCACILTSLAFHLLVERPLLRALSTQRIPATLATLRRALPAAATTDQPNAPASDPPALSIEPTGARHRSGGHSNASRS